MKVPLLVVALLLPGAAAAQDANSIVGAQFAIWRDVPDFQVLQAGSTSLGLRTDYSIVTTSYHTEVGAQRMEIAEAHRASESDPWVLTSRIVGDGKWLWRFDFDRREFTAAPYALEEGLDDNAARNGMLTLANVAAKGETTWAVRLLREVFGGPNSQYRDWQPPAALIADNDVLYRIGPEADPRREMRWALDRSGPPTDRTPVIAASYNHREQIGASVRRTGWGMRFYTEWNTTPDFTPLAPASYRSWRAVPWARLAPAQN